MRKKRQHDRHIPNTLTKRRAHAMTRIHPRQQQDRLLGTRSVLQRRRKLARLPRRHTWMVRAGGHQHGGIVGMRLYVLQR
jgi:hypothetical protein